MEEWKNVIGYEGLYRENNREKLIEYSKKYYQEHKKELYEKIKKERRS